jgi:hypothetical protein
MAMASWHGKRRNSVRGWMKTRRQAVFTFVVLGIYPGLMADLTTAAASTVAAVSIESRIG